MYTPKNLGRTFGKHGNYYSPAPNDSFDPAHAFHACIDGMTTTYQKKSVAQAVMEKSTARDERMYNTIDLKTNIGLENTKDLRAEAIRQ